jgi:hypothetical protein
LQPSLHPSSPQQALEGHESEDGLEFGFAILDREKAEHNAVKRIREKNSNERRKKKKNSDSDSDSEILKNNSEPE